MNVRSLHSAASAQYETVSSSRSERASSSERSQLRNVTDRFDLSQRTRAVLDEMRSKPEFDLHVKTTMHPVQLGEQRTYEVFGRMQQGYYLQPHVLRHVASDVGGVLSYGP